MPVWFQAQVKVFCHHEEPELVYSSPLPFTTLFISFLLPFFPFPLPFLVIPFPLSFPPFSFPLIFFPSSHFSFHLKATT